MARRLGGDRGSSGAAWLWSVRLAGRGLRAVLLVYLGLLLMLSWFQARLIFPGAETQGRTEARFSPPTGTELVTRPSPSGGRVALLYGLALRPDGEPYPASELRPGLIYFYGNGMCLRDVVEQVERFRRMGVHVVAAEYEGYGLSDGCPSEAGCYRAADVALDDLVSRPGVDRDRIVAAGWSLGGAVAIDLASRRPVAGLAVFSTFTSLVELSGRQFPFLPASRLLKHRFESEAKLRRLSCPILIGHSRDDDLVPFMMADELAAAASGPVSRVTISGAGHGELFAVGERQIYHAMQQFLDRLSRPAG